MQGLIGIFFVNFSLLFLSSVLVFLDRVRKKEKRLWLDWGGAGVLFLWWLWFIILTFIGVITGFFEWKWWQTATIYLGSLIWGSVVFFYSPELFGFSSCLEKVGPYLFKGAQIECF